jgi:hypothetical protein
MFMRHVVRIRCSCRLKAEATAASITEAETEEKRVKAAHSEAKKVDLHPILSFS